MILLFFFFKKKNQKFIIGIHYAVEYSIVWSLCVLFTGLGISEKQKRRTVYSLFYHGGGVVLAVVKAPPNTAGTYRKLLPPDTRPASALNGQFFPIRKTFSRFLSKLHKYIYIYIQNFEPRGCLGIRKRHNSNNKNHNCV